MQLDAERLKDLQVFNPRELEGIGRRAIDAISQELELLERALAGRDLRAASEAAHRARNETMLVGAGEMTEALQSAEDAARQGLGSDAGQAAAAARALWPRTREAIADATHDTTG